MNFKPGLTKINLNHSITKQGKESGGACFEHMNYFFNVLPCEIYILIPSPS